MIVPRIRNLSLRDRLLLTIVLGALMPLAVVGVWLTRSTQRAGEQLLRSELDAAAQSAADVIEDRWAHAQGDLMLLARNEVATRNLRLGTQQLSPDDSAYLASLAGAMRGTFPTITYRDRSMAPQWQFLAVNGSGSRSPVATFGVTTPITDDAGDSLGVLDARADVAAIVPADSLSFAVAGARLSISDAATRLPLVVLPAAAVSIVEPDSAAGWLRVSKRLASPPLEISVSARTAPYVAPFEQTARLGLAVLSLVALGTLIVCGIIVGRAGGALARLADAADAVAAGNLDQRISWRTDDEIGRVAHAFNTMSDSLRHTLEELSERRALAAVGEFAASLSHEVRNALTAVRVDLQHAARHVSRESKEGQLVTRALTNVRRLDTAVTGSLRAARGQPLERRIVDLRAVLASAVEQAAPVVAAHHGVLEPVPSGPPVLVSGNAAALEQLFMNLLMNAGEALHVGGATVSVAAGVNGASAWATIADAGCGVPAQSRDRLGERIVTSKDTGTGLGVRIARRIAQAHGGDIEFEPRQGGGTVVRVALPTADPRPRASSASAPAASDRA
jgi:signal transduction histidine kinase